MKDAFKKFMLVFGLFLFFFFIVMRPAPAKAGTFWVSFGTNPFYYGTYSPRLYFSSPYYFHAYSFYRHNPLSGPRSLFHTPFSWSKMKRDTEIAIQLTEIKKQEYFARKEAEQKQNQKNESREMKKEDYKSDDSKDIEIEIKSPDDEVHPLESTVLDDGAVAINYY